MAGIQQLLLAAKPAIVSDPNFEYTTLLLPGNGTNGAQNNTFLDSSTNNFTITRNGNTTQGTFSPFSQTGWGNFFDGSGDFLSVASSAAFDIGSSDFTVECWFNANSFATAFGLISRYDNAPAGWVMRVTSATNIRFVRGADIIFDATTTMSVGVWNHVAVVRSGTTLSIYHNGTRINQTTGISNFTDASTALQIGRTNTITDDINGYISNARVVKGTAVYSGATYTVPTAPLTAITNTSLLTCQSNRFIDNSSNAFAITRNGDVSVQAFSPFNPTAAWSAATYGGSGYFDGSGDYLSMASTSALQFGTGDFCVEAWVYLTATPGAQYAQIIGRTEYGTNADWMLQITNSRTLTWFMQNSFVATSTGTIPLNAWTHVAASRSGSSIRLFINGTIDGTATNSGSTELNSSGDYTIGADQGGDEVVLTGYLASLRAVKGSAVYTANFTIPTAPLTAITNTSLLLNYTNAGIYDATSKNDLETVGNAQISTTQSKFGGSSIYLDGTGDYCNTGPTVNLEFGSGDFTIEMWIYPSVTSRMAIYHGSSGTDWSIGIDYNSQKFNIWASSNGTTWNLINADPGGNGIGTTTISVNTWTHVAFVRSGTTWQTYINGTRDINLTGISGSIVNRATSAKSIGKWWFSNGVGVPGVWNGYMQDVRITKGVARYTANFTAPTAAFPVL
jgi:hypothetical protein